MKRINGEINANLTDTEYAEDMQPLLVGYAAMLKKAEQWLKENPQ